MWRFIKGLFSAGVVIAAIVFGGAYALPEVGRSERHVVIAADPKVVYAEIGDLHRFMAWAPWANAEGRAAAQYSGPAAGAGQVVKWTASHPGTLAVTAADGERQFAATLELAGMGKADMIILLAPVDGGTGLTWTLTMPAGRLLDRWPVFFSFDDDVSPDLVEGLAALKAVVEKHTVENQGT